MSRSMHKILYEIKVKDHTVCLHMHVSDVIHIPDKSFTLFHLFSIKHQKTERFASKGRKGEEDR